MGWTLSRRSEAQQDRHTVALREAELDKIEAHSSGFGRVRLVQCSLLRLRMGEIHELIGKELEMLTRCHCLSVGPGP